MLTSEWMSLTLFGCCSQPSSSSPSSPYSVGTQLSTKYGRLHPMTCSVLRWPVTHITVAMVQTCETKKLRNILHQVLFNWIATTAIYDILSFKFQFFWSSSLFCIASCDWRWFVMQVYFIVYCTSYFIKLSVIVFWCHDWFSFDCIILMKNFRS